MAEKRYFWLKLKEDFFQQLEIKKLRKVAGGDTYTIIFLKLQLLSLKTDGLLEFIGLEEDFGEELALTIDEDANNVNFVLMYLKKIGWLKEESDNIYSLPNTIENIGSETAAANRMRKMRNNTVTTLQSNVTMLQKCSTDIEIDKEQDIESDLEGESEPNGSTPTLSPKKRKTIRHSYGEYDNVLLSDDELEKLKIEIPDYNSYIENLSSYIASTGKKYKSHYATIRNWVKKDKDNKKGFRRENINTQPDYNSKPFWED